MLTPQQLFKLFRRHAHPLDHIQKNAYLDGTRLRRRDCTNVAAVDGT